MEGYEFHEYADLFPLMTGDDFAELRNSIAASGLEVPIVLYEEKILDGRNRYIACLDTDTAPRYETYEGSDPLGYAIRLNLNRRHLTAGQRAVIALDALPMLEEEARGRMVEAGGYGNITIPSERGTARAAAGEMFNVSPSYVQQAKKIQQVAPELLEKVRSGEVSLSRAKAAVRKSEMRENVSDYTRRAQEEELPDKRYHVILADPPWRYGSLNTLDGVTDAHYHTMPIDEICSFLDDRSISVQDNAVLFLWATNPFLEKALSVVNAWGFKYKTNIAWVKTELKKPGVGYYVRGRHELLFICTRGSFTPLSNTISPPIGSVLKAPVGQHSKKPEGVYDIIERLYPDCLYIELFARDARPGWDFIGNEVAP